MPSPALCLLPAIEMQRRLRSKELSARELLDAHLARIASINPGLNAIVTHADEGALRRQAAQLDEDASHGRFHGPLHGLPVVHKDLQDTAGLRTTYGSPLFRDHVPSRSTLLVERMQHAGALALGKTNTPEFGAGSQTFNPVFGPTRNPWDQTKTCGGSSGGAAVALATGMAALADGSDLGGSLRNPASFCSVTGFRPSPGRVPRWPGGAPWSWLNVDGPMARTVADLALLLSVQAGPDPRVPLSLPDAGATFAQPLERDFKETRLAWMPAFAGLPFDPRTRAVFAAARPAFEALGCRLEETPGPDFTGAGDIFRTLRAFEFHQQYAALAAARGRDQMKATVLEEIDRGAALGVAALEKALAGHAALYARAGEFMRDYHYLVLPTTQVPPFDITTEYIRDIDGVPMGTYIDWMSSCWYVSLTGLPAISVPGGFTADGLPVGIQIVGRQHADFAVLQLAHAFEQAARPTS